ncbi:MAG TPA: STAS domain-containing protein [Ilumatobacteraceae bacterium]|nr:STAS domain-containing protein [Ilumatobacteraceae bacterium]
MTPNWEWQQRTETSSVLIVRGDLDVAVGVVFVDAVDKVLAADGPPAEVVIELGEVDFIDSSGLRALLQLRHNYGERVQVGAISAAVERLLELTGTLEHFRPGGTNPHD